jgi:hypothetical protein
MFRRADPMLEARLAGILLALAGCASPTVNARPVAPPPVTPPAANFADGDLGRLYTRSLEFPVELSLPDRKSWAIADGPNWFVATQSSSRSVLSLRTWRAARLVRRADCIAEAKLGRPGIPVLDDDSLVERRPINAPPGFDSELQVGVTVQPDGVHGYALVFGANVGRCYAAVFDTTTEGQGADAEVARRLRSMVDDVFEHVRLRGVDERAVRHRLVSTPE